MSANILAVELAFAIDSNCLSMEKCIRKAAYVLARTATHILLY